MFVGDEESFLFFIRSLDSNFKRVQVNLGISEICLGSKNKRGSRFRSVNCFIRYRGVTCPFGIE